MPLTDNKVKGTKPQTKPFKLADGGGLFLLVNPDGRRYWRLKYRYAGKEKLLALGVYPTVSLAEARVLRDQAKTTLRARIDPGAERKEAKLKQRHNAANTFEAIAKEWHAKQTGKWTPGHAEKVMGGLKLHVFPTIGNLPMDAIKPRDLLILLEQVGAKSPDRAKRLRQYCDQVFRMALIDGRAESNPAADLSRALHGHQKTHYAALNREQLPVFMQALAADKRMALPTRYGLRLLSLTFVRPGELRQARWAEFDLDTGLWTIPAARMKARQEHLVPLCPQALTTLRDLKALTGNCELLFPSRSNVRRPISENTFRKALHDLGFMVTAHGFRSTASTILNEMGFRADVIERQLAHGDRNKVRAAYNRAQYLDERRGLMNHWGKYLASLETGNEVVPLLRVKR